ncbi:MAG: cytochrome C oxidase subunit II [Betaproteobacteria bacterium]
MTQTVAWITSLALMALVAAVFARVCLGAGEARDVEHPYRGRALVFWGLLAAGAVITFATLDPWPLAAYAASSTTAPPVKVVEAVGHQWRWELSDDTVPAGQPVEFRVSAGDVNHGFAIYRDTTHLVAQTQAMPGFVNRLRVTFDRPGEYEVLCLEYCGVAHHGMRTVIKVVNR